MFIKPRYLGELVRLDPITSHIKSKISELETQRDIYEKQGNKLAAFGCTGQILAYSETLLYVLKLDIY